MNVRAAWSTALVHMAATMLAALPIAAPARAVPPPPILVALPEGPAIVLVSAHRAGRAYEAGRADRQFADTGCPRQRPVDRDAEPDFPNFGPDRPFRLLPETPSDPVFCVLIGADGRVLRVRTAGGSGKVETAMRRTVRRLHFVPALRGGVPAAAWHRLIVNRAEGLPDRRAGLVDPIWREVLPE